MRRAKLAGLTLADYIEQILEREVARPAPIEVFERISARQPVDLGTTAATLLRAERRDRSASNVELHMPSLCDIESHSPSDWMQTS